jgi:hypothetical protein
MCESLPVLSCRDSLTLQVVPKKNHVYQMCRCSVWAKRLYIPWISKCRLMELDALINKRCLFWIQLSESHPKIGDSKSWGRSFGETFMLKNFPRWFWHESRIGKHCFWWLNHSPKVSEQGETNTINARNKCKFLNLTITRIGETHTDSSMCNKVAVDGGL